MNLFTPRPTGLFGALSHDGVRKPRVFISYHHQEDQWYRDQLVAELSNTYDLFYDNSVDTPIGSDDNNYIRRVIREQKISSTSLTIVLCGRNTPGRKWVDWEIAMTLRKEHALVGIIFPGNVGGLLSSAPVLPARLRENVISGYAHYVSWSDRLSHLASAIAWCRARPKSLIRNSTPEMQRNRSQF